MSRVTGAWRGMSGELRMAVVAAFLLFVSMFLPWYEKSYFANVKGRLAQASDGLNAFQAFSFVEAAVLLVALAVIALCFARGERRAFHLPGGDGVVVMAAGGWVGLLLIYRLFDKPNASVPGGAAVTVGIQWGIFFAIAAAAFLVYCGYRIYHAHRPEPPLPGEVNTAAQRRETRATEPLIRDQRRPPAPAPTPPAPPSRPAVPERPPSAEARAAADRNAAGRGPAERATAERPTSVTEELHLDPPPDPELPPEWPHAAGAPPEWPDLHAMAAEPDEEEDDAEKPPPPPRERGDDPTLF